MVYNPRPVPTDPKQLPGYLAEELRELSRILGGAVPSMLLEELHQEPEKTSIGLVVLADGVDWNPGSGRGIYWYDNEWKFLG